MTSREALDAKNLGHAVRREAWPAGQYVTGSCKHTSLHLPDGSLARRVGGAPLFTAEDFAATDWVFCDGGAP